jgi:large subunit ribosomal protein L25
LDTVKLTAEPRTILGKNVKILRRQGLVPANMYGHGRPSEALQLPERQVSQHVTRASRSTLFSLEVPSGVRTVLVKEVQRHPTTGKVLHVDFYQVAMSEKLKVGVPLHFVGEAPAVRRYNGTMLHNVTQVEVEALPADLPTSIEVDVSGLETTDEAIHVRDIVAPEGVTIVTDGDELVAKVAPSAVEVEEEAAPAAEAEAAAAAEDTAEASEETA